jgi:DNA polymerase III subunit gamma/tau
MSNFLSIDDIKGQDVALGYLHTYVKNPEKIPPLLIFHGPDGVGKWSMVERFACQILCFEGSGCGKCESCKMFIHHNHPDYIQFPVDTRIAIGNEKEPEEFSIRWLQSKRINYRPHSSSRRLIVFPDASLINDEAETALLKSLEEPPQHTRFIFIVNELRKLKQTIISRAICIPFQFLDKKVVEELAQENSYPVEEFFGGSLSFLNVPREVFGILKEKIDQYAGDPLFLLELEAWVKSYKDNHPEWKEDFDYKEFLELFSLLLIHFYYKNGKKTKQISAVFLFKELIHRNIAGLEPYIISRLFYQLALGK